MRTRHPALALAALLVLAGCGRDPGAAGQSADPAATASPRPVGAAASTDRLFAKDAGAQAPPTASPCAAVGWDCPQLARFDAAAQYVRERPGRLGVVVRDRTTGAVWRAGTTTDPMWTGSTIKVAIAATLLERHRAGKIKLTAADRSDLADMLRQSSNDATDTLWKRYDGPKMLDRFREAYGMDSLAVVSGMDVYWRNLRCTVEDLDHLMQYVLNGRLHPDDRAYLVDTLRGVAINQRWGVWAAGPAMQPGNKDGWALKPDAGGEHWIAHTVGFAGPDERYIVTVMYSLPAGRQLETGVQAVSDIVALIFGGPTPAEVSEPSA